MFYGILGVTAIAFSCSTEFIPEINQQMKLVPFVPEFKTTLTAVMIIDYLGCYLIEIVLKRLFSDFRPRDIAERRPDQLEREGVRKAEEQKKKEEEEEKKAAEQVAEMEKKIEEKARQLRAWTSGTPQAQRQVQ
jgi:cation-transporting ATPase 13A1